MLTPKAEADRQQREAIHLRASEHQTALLDRAAEALGRTRSDFMLDAACREAESILGASGWTGVLAPPDQAANSQVVAEIRSHDAAAGTNGEASAQVDAELKGCSDARRTYETRLRQELESTSLGQIVAIHPQSGSFEVGRNSPSARRALRQKCPDGMIVTMAIGQGRPEPAIDRLLAIGSRRS